MEQTRPVIAAEVDQIQMEEIPSSEPLVELAREAGGMPTMVVQTPQKPPEPDKVVVTPEQMQEFLKEAVGWIRDDRTETAELIKNFVEMVINEGDSSGPTKEALCNLVRLKHETAVNLTKLLDLMMRPLLKDRDTFKPYMNNTQHNEIKINPRRKIVEKFARKAQELKKGN